jgi:hypothetical protein
MAPRPPTIALVVIRNAVPVVGVYALGWSSDLIVLDYWFDGVTALAALIWFGLALDRSAPWSVRLPASSILFVLLGIPYWFALGWIHALALGPGWWRLVVGDPVVVGAFLAIGLANFVKLRLSGFASMSSEGQRKVFQWEFNLLLARVALIMLVAFFLPRAMVIGTTAALTWLELHPLKALQTLGAPVTRDDIPEVAEVKR